MGPGICTCGTCPGPALVVTNSYKKKPFYVTNTVSQECIELPYHYKNDIYPLGIVTRTENGVVLSYKAVLFDIFRFSETKLRFLIYSSETCLWNLKTIYLPFSLPYQYNLRCVSLNGNLYWLNRNSENEYFLVSQDFYATGTDSDIFRVTSFPDLGKHPKLRRACTISQGFLMYMNIVSETKDDKDKLRVWRLKSEELRQLVYEISVDFKPHFDDIPLTINNPFDAKTIYFWSKSQNSLLSYYLCHGKFVLLKHSNDGRIVNSGTCPRVKEYIKRSHFPSFVLPKWLRLN